MIEIPEPVDFLPDLPREHGGQPITWGPWEPAWGGTTAGCGRPRLPRPCTSCGTDGPDGMLTATGRHGKAQTVAHFCQTCRELRVYLVPLLRPGERGKLHLLAHQPGRGPTRHGDA